MTTVSTAVEFGGARHREQGSPGGRVRNDDDLVLRRLLLRLLVVEAFCGGSRGGVEEVRDG